MDTPTQFLTSLPGPGSSRPVLRGRHLRYALLVILGSALRPLSVAELERSVHELGFTIPPRAGKQISDALRWERRRGRVVRRGRDRYVAGVIPRSTAHRARVTLRRVRAGRLSGDGADAMSGARLG